MLVFLCNCRNEISLPADLDFGEDVYIRVHSELCSPEGKGIIAEALKGEPSTKIVIAGCSPRVAERYFRDLDAEIVNLREQAAYVGHGDQKVKDLIKGGIERAKKSKGIPKRKLEIKNKSVLVMGGGVAGLEATRQIAEAGNKVFLIEKTPFLGGMVAKLDRLYPEGTPNSHTLYPLINEVLKRETVEIFTSAKVENVQGSLGDYTVTLKVPTISITGCTLCKKCEEVCPLIVEDYGIKRKAIYYLPTYPDSYAIDYESCNFCGKCAQVCNKIHLTPEQKSIELHVGCLVLATGLFPFDAAKIREYGYGQYEKVLTTLEFERKLAREEIHPQKVVIVNCAGSRDQKYLPYCSRVCCLIGLKEAKLLKDKIPEAEIYVTYIDMRSYGDLDGFYETLREVYGINFIRGKPSEVIQKDGRIVARIEDIFLGEDLEIDADFVVLSTGFVPDSELLKRLRIPAPGEFPRTYRDSCLSVDSNPRGIYIAGSAACPQGVAESIVQARDVATAVNNTLKKDFVELVTPVPAIESKICSALNCKLCLSACPYGAIVEEGEEIKVIESMCMGCGTCTATCASGANQLEGSTSSEILAQIKGLIREGSIAAFLCKWSAYNAADKAGYERLNYPESVRIMRVPCTGRVDGQMVLAAFEQGAKGVLLGGCYPEACHYLSGNLKARKRVLALGELISQFGFDPRRLRVEWIGKDESQKLSNILIEMERR